MRNEQTDKLSHSSEYTGNGVTSGLKYLLIGGGIGAAIALLFAPKSGTELRGEISDVTKRGLDATKDKATELRAQSSEAIEAIRGKADEIYKYAQGRLGKSQDALDLATFETAMIEDNVRELPSHKESVSSQRAVGRKPSSIM